MWRSSVDYLMKFFQFLQFLHLNYFIHLIHFINFIYFIYLIANPHVIDRIYIIKCSATFIYVVPQIDSCLRLNLTLRQINARSCAFHIW
jgi:hypothetical protein